MTDRQFQIEFERRLQLMDPELVHTNKLNSDTIFSFINEAIDKFYKTRYSGINAKSEGFEQSLKRIDDLRNLIKTASFKRIEEDNKQVKQESDSTVNTVDNNIVNNGNIYTIKLPEDYVLMLGDVAGILPTEGNGQCWETGEKDDDDEEDNYVVKHVDTIEATIENIDRQLNNSLSEHLLKYCTARPLKLIQGNQVILYTDGKYSVANYQITYLSKPLFLDSSNISNTEYTSLPEHTHMEIVKMAVQLYLATKPMQHYSAYSSEVNNME